MRARLLDTGPLVAYLNAKEAAHTAVAACLDGFTGQLFTTCAVITEAMYLIGCDTRGPSLLVDFILASGLRIHECTQADQLRKAADLMASYSDLPMDFADATLVLLGEQLRLFEIVTLDRRGFSAYRTPSGKSFRMLPMSLVG